MIDDEESCLAPQRLRVRRLAASGLPAETIRQLCGHDAGGELMPPALFAQLFARELMLGNAEADSAVGEALFELARSCKSVQATLAWARQRLGWRGETEEIRHDDSAASSDGFAGLQALMDELATRKAGGADHAPPLAADSPPQPDITRTG